MVVATDDQRIAEHCREHAMEFVLTSPQHPTGTDRVAEVARAQEVDWYVNVQGDEPFVDPLALEAVLRACEEAPPDLAVVNTYSPIDSEEDFRNPNVPKVIVRADGRMQYISRAPVPMTKTCGFVRAWRQVGLYAFRGPALEAFSAFPERGSLEAIEDIEILRFLDLGIDVRMIEVSAPGIAIDTPEDLERAERSVWSARSEGPAE